MQKLIPLIVLVIASVIGFIITSGAAMDSNANNAPSCQIDAPNFYIYDNPSTYKKSPCNFSIIYAYDNLGGWYKDFGNGEIYTSSGITSIKDLDSATLTTCGFQVHARGSFDDNKSTVTGDSGSIFLVKHCYGYEYNDFNNHGTELYRIVSPDDPRYTGNPAWPFETWEFQIWIKSHFGNLVVRSLLP